MAISFRLLKAASLLDPDAETRTGCCMQWYYAKGGVQTGPLEESELRSRIARGEIAASEMIWREGMPDWVPLSQIPEFMSLAPGASSQPPSLAASQAPVSNYSLQAPIPTYLWQSIVVTLLCCWPLGIPAIVFAAKVDSLRSRGDIAGAHEASGKAKTWCTISFISGLVIGVIYLIAIVASQS